MIASSITQGKQMWVNTEKKHLKCYITPAFVLKCNFAAPNYNAFKFIKELKNTFNSINNKTN